ncbi:MAG: hypothetical protein AAGA61_09735, partial [Pseudomonadota bacterium]
GLSPFFAAATVARVLVPVLALTYIIYLLVQSKARTGRVTVIAVWVAVAIAAWLFVSSFPAYLMTHTAAIWLVRSLYFHGGVLACVADFSLTALASAFTIGVLLRTGNPALATWSFFLTQALFPAIPAAFVRRAPHSAPPAGFERASRQADMALRHLSTRR